jgi:YidC/Oxa1 family membrane protein insertase
LTLSPILAAGFFGIEHFTPPWDVFFLPLFNLLVLAYHILFSDFALAIIVFTVVVRTVLAPLFLQQIRSQREMQRMQPLIREVQRKHKGNTQKITQETQALYREHGVNPLGGCLPLLLQLPILYSLYQALIRASGVVQNFVPNSGDQAAFNALQTAGVVHPIAGLANHFQVAVNGPCDLQQYSQLPQFLPLNCQLLTPLDLSSSISTKVPWLFNLDLSTPDHTLALLIPGTAFAISLLAIIAAVLQFVQVKMTSPRPNPDDPTTNATSTMTYVFPLMTIVWGGLFPAGLILYWIVYTAYLVGHQYLMMGWGNLFPIFGWSPPFAKRDDEPPRRPPRREAEALPEAKSSAQAERGARGSSQPATSTPSEENRRQAMGQRAATGAQSRAQRSGGRRRRGRRR